MSNEQVKLKKDLGLISALSLVVGMVLGAGAFMKPSSVLSTTGDTSMALWAWVIGGILSMAGGLTLCELGVMFPRTGGIFVFLEELYNKKTSFLYGWVLTFIYGPATIGALTGYFSSVFCLLFSIHEYYSPLVGAGVLAFVLFVNSVSVKQAGRLQAVATFCKLIPLVLIMVFGLLWGNGKVFMQSTNMASVMGPFSAAVLATLFAYDGWAQVASVAGEIKNPAKLLPRAIIGGLCFLIVVYVGINIAMFKVLSAAQIVTLGHDAAAVVSQKLFGIAGGNLVAVGIMVSILGGINGYTMTLSRIVYTMGERKQLPYAGIFGKLDADSKTPVAGAVLLGVLSFIFYRMFDADRLSDIAVFAIWIFYMLTFAGVIIGRKKFPDIARSYKVPLYPFIPILAICGALYCLYGMIQSNFMNAAMAIILTLVGLPVYSYLSRTERKIKLPRIKTCYIVAFVSLLVMGGLYISTVTTDNRPVLRVAVAPSVKPYLYEEQDGTKAGFEMELLEKIARDNGYRLQVMPYDFAALFGVMAAGKADIAAGMISVTEQREQTMNFSTPYYSGRIILVGHKNAKLDSNSAQGKRIGVIAQSVGMHYAEKMSGADVRPYESSSDLFQAYRNGELDGMIWDGPMLLAMKLANPDVDGEIKQVFETDQYAFAVDKKASKLLTQINQTIGNMEKDGELDKIREKWHIDK